MADRKRLRLAEPDRFDPSAKALLAATFAIDEGTVAPRDLTGVFESVDAFWFRLGHRIGRHNLPAKSRVRAIATPVTGLDHIDLKWCKEVGVRVVSLKGEVEFLREVRATAEHTFALMLALVRNLPAASLDVEQGNWNRDAFAGSELYQKTLGIVGLGRLGTIVADIARAFGMRVLAYDPHVEDAAVQSLQDLARESDILSIHANYAEETRHLVDETVFAHLKPGAFLVNTSRGGIVDERALLDALEEGRLAGAALDVLSGEPEISESPIVAYARDHTNLLVTPHIGGNTRESFEKTEQFLARRLLEVFQ